MTHKKKNQNTAPTPPKNTRHLTAERLHDLARKWKRAQSAERAVALFTYSPEHGVQTAVFGCDEYLTEIVTSGVRLCLAPSTPRHGTRCAPFSHLGRHGGAEARELLAASAHVVSSVQHQVIFNRNERYFV